MDMETIKEFMKPELLILAPVLNIIGVGLKSSGTFDNKYIPLMLGALGIALCLFGTIAFNPITNFQEALTAVFTGITQGILCAGFSVYAHQLKKQHIDNINTEQA